MLKSIREFVLGPDCPECEGTISAVTKTTLDDSDSSYGWNDYDTDSSYGWNSYDSVASFHPEVLL